MYLRELEEHLDRAKKLLSPNDDIQVAFCIRDEKGKQRYICFNVVTIYTEDKLISFSIEGPITETWHDYNTYKRCPVCGTTGWHSFSCTNKGY